MTAKLSAAKYRQLEQATDYATWRTHAVDLDAQSDMDVWKTNPHSPHYQHQLIQQRLINLRAWLGLSRPLFSMIPSARASASLKSSMVTGMS